MYALTIIKFPSGRYGYVGRIPTVLGYELTATRSDIMGGRTHKNDAGENMVWKFPSFDTVEEAQAHAKAHGYNPYVLS